MTARTGRPACPAEHQPRRLLVTVCPRERGTITLPVERRGVRRRLDARAIVRALADIVGARGLRDTVSVGEGCAGGCHGRGPNISVTMYPPRRPGERPDTIAVAWRSYVGSLAGLACLADIIAESGRPGPRRRLPARRPRAGAAARVTSSPGAAPARRRRGR